MQTIDNSRIKTKKPSPLKNLISKGENQEIQIIINKKPHQISVSTKALHIFNIVLSELEQGKEVTVVANDSELSTQQAADILKVSRPYVVKLLEEGKIPFRSVGKYRKICFADLMRYKEITDKESTAAMIALMDEAQELGMGYDS